MRNVPSPSCATSGQEALLIGEVRAGTRGVVIA